MWLVESDFETVELKVVKNISCWAWSIVMQLSLDWNQSSHVVMGAVLLGMFVDVIVDDINVLFAFF